MPYSVWMDGTKIGDTSLEISHGSGRRAGVFHPTASGLAVLPGITAMAPALLDAGRICRENGIDTDGPDLDGESATATLFDRPEGQRIMEAAVLVARLELYGPGGELIQWESLLISDMTEIAAMSENGSAIGRKMTGRIDKDPIRSFISAKFVAPQWDISTGGKNGDISNGA